MSWNTDTSMSLFQAGTGSATGLHYLQDLQVRSALRKISETGTTVEDIVELTAATQAALSSSDATA